MRRYFQIGALTFTLSALCLATTHASTPAMAYGPPPADPVKIIDPNSPEKSGYLLTASDEFNGKDVNHNLFYDRYLPHWSTAKDTKARYKVEDGLLKLRIDKDQEPWDPKFDSQTRVSSLQTFEKDYIHRWTKYPDIAQHIEPFRGHIQKYGYFEIRAKAAPGGGLHSAWWMTGVNQDRPEGENRQAGQTGEVDIFEILGRWNGKEARLTIHPWGDRPKLWDSTGLFGKWGTDYTRTWHTYGFEWLPDRMNLYLDGELVDTRKQSPNYPMMTYLGVYEKRQALSWTGPFDSSVPYPKTFEIDYFRAYQKIPDKFPYTWRINDGYLRGQTVARQDTTRWLGGPGNDATLTEVYAPKDGAYRLALGYKSGNDRSLDISVNNKKLHFDKLNSGSFTDKFKNLYFTANLKKGWNTVRFYNESGPAPDLGNLSVLGHANPQLPYTQVIAEQELFGSVTNQNGVTRWLGNSADNYVLLPNIYAPKDGEYTVSIEHRGSDSRDLYLTVNGKKTIRFQGLKNGGYWGEFSNVTARIQLKQGYNELKLGNPTSYAPDLGKLTLSVPK